MNNENTLYTATELRRNAEEQLKEFEVDFLQSDNETQRLYHELQVHQIELEMQNEELHQAKDDVDNALAMFTDLYDFAPVGYCTLDRDGIISAANLSTTSLLGVERSRLLGRNFGRFVASESLPRLSEFLEKVFASSGKGSCEVKISSEKNSSHFVRLDAFACISGQECNVAVIDISEHRHAEIELRKKQLEMEELNGSLEARIDQAVNELRQKDQMLILQDRRAIMGEMINNIAHQWRQPLNILGLYVQELLIFYDTGDFSRELLAGNTDKGMHVIQQMSQTIDDFRNFFRPDKEAITFSVNQVIAQTVSLINKSFQEQGIIIVIHSESDPRANGYPNEYAQVVLNILMNARDALIGNNLDDALISIRVSEENNTSVVTISDGAGGIAEEIIDRIFDPYFTTKGPDEGTGIGLFMSKAIIEKNMGGRLTVRNYGSGAEFRIEV